MKLRKGECTQWVWFWFTAAPLQVYAGMIPVKSVELPLYKTGARMTKSGPEFCISRNFLADAFWLVSRLHRQWWELPWLRHLKKKKSHRLGKTLESVL